MIVERYEFSIERLERYGSGAAENSGVGLPLQCSFDCTVRTDDGPAICALDDRIVGQVVGHVLSGTQALDALYFDDDGTLCHSRILPLQSASNQQACATANSARGAASPA